MHLHCSNLAFVLPSRHILGHHLLEAVGVTVKLRPCTSTSTATSREKKRRSMKHVSLCCKLGTNTIVASLRSINVGTTHICAHHAVMLLHEKFQGSIIMETISTTNSLDPKSNFWYIQLWTLKNLGIKSTTTSLCQVKTEFLQKQSAQAPSLLL